MVVVCWLAFSGGHAHVDGIHLVLLERALLHLRERGTKRQMREKQVRGGRVKREDCSKVHRKGG